MKKVKKSKGITLIALVITIIVLLILAGVSIAMLRGDNNIITKASQAKEKNSQSSAKEKLELVLIDLQTDKVTDSNYNNGQYLNNKIQENNMKVDGNDVIVDNWKFEIDRDSLEIVKSLGRLNNELEDNNIDETNFAKIVDWNARKNIVKEYKCQKIKDLSGNNIDTIFTNVTLNENKDAIYFAGNVNSSGDIENEGNFNINSYSCTVSFAIKPESSSAYQFIFADGVSKTCFSFNSESILVSGPSSNIYMTPDDFFDGNIKYISIIYDTASTDHQLYINGNKIDKSSETGYWNLTSNVGTFGRRYYKGYNSPYTGFLYNFRVYSKVLSEEEIKSDYNETKNVLENNGTYNKPKDLKVEYMVKQNDSIELEKDIYIKMVKDNSDNNSDLYLANTIYNEDEKAIQFNGESSTGYSLLNKKISFPCTIMCALKPSKEAKRMSVPFSDYNSGIVLGISSIENDDEITCSSANSHYVIPGEEFRNDEIQYLTVVYGENAKSHQLYLNGEKIEKSLDTGYWNLNSTQYAFIGYRNYNNPSYYKGLIYMIKIYNQDFNDEQIKKAYHNDLIEFEN